jgi:hypothetical protein
MWRWHELGPGCGGESEAGGERQWKYVWLANGGREQLFDLTDDPQETVNLAARDGARCQAAHRQLVEWCLETGFASAVEGNGAADRLRSLPFEALPLPDVKPQQPAWPARDPDFVDLAV